MKRIYIDIKEVASYKSLLRAYHQAIKGKKGKKKQVSRYSSNLEENLRCLSGRLVSGTWTPDRGRVQNIMSEGKLREIHIVCFEDRIVHQALDISLGSVLRGKFVRRTYGSIKKKGSLNASLQVRKDIKSNKPIVIKLDVRKYYPSIDKAILKNLIRQTIKGEAVLKLTDKIIDSYKPAERGISIGSLLSQTFGNFYLTYFDYFCLQELKARHYVRYVDDVVILSDNKGQAAEWIKRMSAFLGTNLHLEFGKIEVFPIAKRKIDFCMYQVDATNVKLRKRVLRKFTRKLRQLQKCPANPTYERSCVYSYLGFLKYCKSYKILNQLKNEYSEVFLRIDRFAAGKRHSVANPASPIAGAVRI